MYACIHIYVYTYTCKKTYTCIYVYISILVYTYIYINICQQCYHSHLLGEELIGMVSVDLQMLELNRSAFVRWYRLQDVELKALSGTNVLVFYIYIYIILHIYIYIEICLCAMVSPAGCRAQGTVWYKCV